MGGDERVLWEHQKGCLVQSGDVRQSPLSRNHLRQLEREEASGKGWGRGIEAGEQLMQRLRVEREHCNMNINVYN